MPGRSSDVPWSYQMAMSQEQRPPALERAAPLRDTALRSGVQDPARVKGDLDEGVSVLACLSRADA